MALSRRLGPLRWSTVAGVALVCIAIGVLAGIKPTYGIEGALGLMFAVVTIQDVTLGFLLFVVASFLDLASSSGSFSGTKLVGLVLFVSWLARMATRRGADLAAFVDENPVLSFSVVAMLGWAVLSFAWAFSPGTALSSASRYALDMMLIPIAFSAIRTREHALWAVGAFVAGAVFSGLWGFTHPASGASIDIGRLTGTIGDSNAEATVLAAAIPLVIALMAVARNSPRLKVIGLISLGVLLLSLFETLSREGLVALAMAMVAAVVFGGRWRRTATVLLMIGAVATVGYYVVLAPASSLQRVTMSSTSGRTSLWTVAWRVIKAHPVLGVGGDNFILVENQYINQAGAVQALFVVTTPKVTHDSFLEALADLGIPGLLTLVAVLGGCLGAAGRAARIFERIGDEPMELISRAVVFALIATLTANFFYVGAYDKQLWVLLAICPTMLGLARRAAGGAPSRPVALTAIEGGGDVAPAMASPSEIDWSEP
jgi:O-antigen ligase